MGRFILSGHNIDEGVTPIYTRNAAAGGSMGLRSAGDWITFLEGGPSVDTEIPQPVIVAGDRLEVFQVGSGATPSPVEVGEWTARTGLGGGSMTVWYRQATGDADDTFTIPSSFSGIVMSQMASFFQPATQSFVLEQSGVLIDNFNTVWDLDGIGTTAEPETLLLAYYARVRALVQVSPTVTDNSGMNLIGSQTLTQSGPGRCLWGGWSWRFDEASAPVSAVVQGYTPAAIAATQLTRVLRYKSEV